MYIPTVFLSSDLTRSFPAYRQIYVDGRSPNKYSELLFQGGDKALGETGADEKEASVSALSEGEG